MWDWMDWASYIGSGPCFTYHNPLGTGLGVSNLDVSLPTLHFLQVECNTISI